LAGTTDLRGRQAEHREEYDAPPVQVVLVDDYPVAREALPALLAKNGIFVSATAASASDFEEAYDLHNPAVALIGGVFANRVEEVTRRMTEAGQVPRMLIRTHDSDLPCPTQDLPPGVQGAVSRRTSLSDLAQAIRTVAAGGTWFEPSSAAPAAGLRVAKLSDRESRVLIELARGSTTEEIAEELHLTTHTIRSHVRNIMRKLKARSRAHAVAIGCREGLIDVDV
jgi:DNA-binding NarL/FixJ family response regulator